ncbi:hypothetical protein [Aeromicrobium sp. IC_218]|uniref:hypothetical protein n=1 Tax=Aeromicrobium sp. IC_218 TaxID=2545468 RepID=UPI0013F4009E|nr:hypothetical protein [Aeromicrobium sp. IC_218]
MSSSAGARHPSDRRPWVRLAAALGGIGLVALVAGTVVLAVAEPASAGQEDKIGVCHRTASDSNPYVLLVVPAQQASGHITGTDKQHNQQVTWSTSGSWRGVPHAAGDPKLDYFASAEELEAGRCQDTAGPTPTPRDPETEPIAPTTDPTEPEPSTDPTEPPTTEPATEPTEPTPGPDDPTASGTSAPPAPGPDPSSSATTPGDGTGGGDEGSGGGSDDGGGDQDGSGGDAGSTGASDDGATGNDVAVPRNVTAGVEDWSTTQVWGAGLAGGGVAFLLASGGVLLASRRAPGA